VNRLIISLKRRLAGVPMTPREWEASLALMSDLRRWGWHRSVRQGAPALAGAPVPWLTYSAIVALDRAMTGNESVFEYGAGYSTLWFAARARRVISVEGSAEWVKRLREQLPDHVELHAVPHDQAEAYLACIEVAGRSLDVILVDGGPDRSRACRLASQHLVSDGLIILDNSEVTHYADGIEWLGDQGFQRVDFHGPSPGARYIGCTSFFTRSLERWFPGSGVVSPRPIFEDQIARLPGPSPR
jgi:precorrin-6B methylase 2